MEAQEAQEEYRAAVTSCRDEDRKVKVNVKGAWDVKGKKNVVQKYINSKKKTRENMGQLLNAAGELGIKKTNKASILIFSDSVFVSKNGLQ